MKLTKAILGLLIACILGSCSNFDDINTDPDSITRVTPGLLATGAIMNMMTPASRKSFVIHQLVTKHLAWSECIEESTQYNNFGRDGFDGYQSLRNCQLMVEQAEQSVMSEESKSAYKGLALFLKAYKLFNYTLSMGDIPYEGILDGANGNFTVPYNTQEEVFKFLLADLDEAHACFQDAKNTSFDGDPIFNGSVEKWNRVTNTLELRVLTMLSKRASDCSIDVKGKFKEVVSRNLMLRSNNDNLQLVFSSKSGQLYPFNETLQSYKQYAMLSTTVVDVMKSTGDYRLFYYARPSDERIAKGLDSSDWEAYVGVDPSLKFETIAAISDYCNLNDRYTSYDPGEPLIYIGFAEQNFMMAEAALRGWISGDASVFYRQGIEASMNFVADNTPDRDLFHHGRRITADVISNFIQSPAIQLTGNFEKDLYKIMNQKYLAAFMQTPYLAYYDFRRTGYPEFPVNPATNRNSYAPDKMPMRWMYPKREYDYNLENVEAAVKRQYGGSDDINQLMWILK